MSPLKGKKKDVKKRENPAIGWLFTYNNYPKNYFEEVMVPVFQEHEVKIYVCQEEEGELCGTPHYQGWVKFNSKKRWSQFKLNKEIKWIRQKGSDKANIIYCSKDKSCVGTRWSFGVKVPKPIRRVNYNELYPWQAKVACWFDEPCDHYSREINWFWEKKGNVGKSYLCKYFVDNTKCIVLSGKSTDIFNGLKSYIDEHGEGPDIVIIDCPRSLTDYISYSAIEKIKDGLLYSGKYEGGMLRFNTPHIICFSNEMPEIEKMSADRWNIIEVNNFKKWVELW